MQFYTIRSYRADSHGQTYRYRVWPLWLWQVGLLLGLGWLIFELLISPQRQGSEPTFLLWWLFGVGVGVLLIVNYVKRARVHPENWLLTRSPDGLVVKFRSYLNNHFDDQSECIVQIPYAEILWVRRTVEQRIHFGSRTGLHTHMRCQWLDLKLCSGQLSELSRLIQSELQREGEWRNTWYGRTRGRSKHHPVRLLEGDVLRIEWGVSDSLSACIEQLAPHVAVLKGKQILTDLMQIKSLTKEAQEALILELLEMGDRIQAIKVVKHLYGIDTTAAERFVAELIGERSIPMRLNC